jgi:enoyl-CoA hydratase/carnithine racemase
MRPAPRRPNSAVDRCRNPEIKGSLLEGRVLAMVRDTMLDPVKLRGAWSTSARMPAPQGRGSTEALQTQKRRVSDIYASAGDHWGAEEAFRMGVVQEIAPTREKALDAGIAIATEIAACGPLGMPSSRTPMTTSSEMEVALRSRAARRNAG